MPINIDLNEQQLAAVQETSVPVLVIAGAGSGKTRVLTARICYLIEQGVSPHNIIAITFTNKAANEMKDRIKSYLGDYASGIWASTFHSMCAKILRIHAEKIDYERNFSIYTEVESERVVRRICDSLGMDPKSRGEYLHHISIAKTAGLSPSEYYDEMRGLRGAQTIFKVYSAYEAELKKSNALDFDDLLLKVVKLFDTCPNVLEIYANRFRYILVDEFQDTNRLQYKLVLQLSSKWKSVFVVGDEDQNIYTWRGAEIKNILDFKNDFPNAKTYKLEQNYRSTTTILDAANRVIKNNTQRNEKKLWSDNGKGANIVYYHARNDRDEARFVREAIERLYCEGVPYSEIAVLMRINAISRTFEEELNFVGIPYKVFGGFRFFERKEIKDTLAYIRLLLNPHDNDSFLRVVNYPRRGIGKTTIEEISTFAENKQISFWDVLNNPSLLGSSSTKKLASFAQTMQELKIAMDDMEPEAFIKHLIKYTGIESLLMQSNDPADKNRLENIMELVNAVHEFMEDNKNASMADFIQSVALVADKESTVGDDFVSIATVHAVKGLEFDTVFIVGVEEMIFPAALAIYNNTVEEERRLMYVAITRARKRLYVTHAENRFRFGKVDYMIRSRFINEMRGDKPKPRAPGQERHVLKNNDLARINSVTGNAIKSQTTSPVKPKDFSPERFNKNTVVEHTKFGRGLIIDATGDGDNKIVAIAFKSLGVKRFALSVAANSLTIVEEKE